MYDRAARTLHLTVGCTPDHVGPGTYDHRRKKANDGECYSILLSCSLFFSFFFLESYAPFLSLANRGDIFSNGDNPGPGHYDVRSAQPLNVKVS